MTSSFILRRNSRVRFHPTHTCACVLAKSSHGATTVCSRFIGTLARSLRKEYVYLSKQLQRMGSSSSQDTQDLRVAAQRLGNLAGNISISMCYSLQSVLCPGAAGSCSSVQ